jgi:hypothetical protein
MPLYHYLLRGADGRIVTTVSAEHRSDGAASAAAQLHYDPDEQVRTGSDAIPLLAQT